MPCDPTHDVLLNAATFATAELNSEHLAAGVSTALSAVMHIAASAALGATREVIGVHNVRIITDAPGLSESGGQDDTGLQGGSSADLLHFDVAFGLCGPQDVIEAAEGDKRNFERVLGRVAAESFEAFKISTIRLLELESRFKTSVPSTSMPSSTQPVEEQPAATLWEEIWWLPWLGCIFLLFAGAVTYFYFHRRRKRSAEYSFDGAVSTRQVDAESSEWKWNRYVVRVVSDFKAQLDGTALDLLEGDLVQVEAEVDNAWLYGHTARDCDVVGFVAKSYVERLGTGRGAQPLYPQPASPPMVPPQKGLVVTALSKVQSPLAFEVFATSRGWLYGRPVGTSVSSWFPENSVVEVPEVHGPRFAAHGTVSLNPETFGAIGLEGASNCHAPMPTVMTKTKPIAMSTRRSFSRQLTDAITSSICTGAWPKS